jgi:hypothetical protein
MIVAGEEQHAAMRRGAGGVGMLQRIGRAVDAGTLAVPDAEDAVDGGALVEIDLLAAPHGGGGEVLVDAGLELDAAALEEALGRPQCVVIGAERRAAIAGDEAAGLEPRGGVALHLHDRQPDERLDAVEIDAPRLQIVFIVERDLREWHPASPMVRRRF